MVFEDTDSEDARNFKDASGYLQKLGLTWDLVFYYYYENLFADVLPLLLFGKAESNLAWYGQAMLESPGRGSHRPAHEPRLWAANSRPRDTLYRQSNRLPSISHISLLTKLSMPKSPHLRHPHSLCITCVDSSVTLAIVTT
jgi:hypothetical protein